MKWRFNPFSSPVLLVCDSIQSFKHFCSWLSAVAPSLKSLEWRVRGEAGAHSSHCLSLRGGPGSDPVELRNHVLWSKSFYFPIPQFLIWIKGYWCQSMRLQWGVYFIEKKDTSVFGEHGGSYTNVLLFWCGYSEHHWFIAKGGGGGSLHWDLVSPAPSTG
jgi:hypothetical protein